MKLIVTTLCTIALSAGIWFSMSKPALSQAKTDEKAQAIVDRAILAHGGDLYQKARVKFTFRAKRHTIVQNANNWYYSRSFTEEGKAIVDTYENGTFSRTVNGKTVELSDRNKARYIEDVNGVSYFAMLPYKLNDAAVIKEYVGETSVNGLKYDKVKVTFGNQGGGHSPDNVFYYWFDQSTGFMEYLAYNKGGNRFRAPYNVRVIKGIRFADNVNYSGGSYAGESIESYDKRYEASELKELSRIILEDVEVEILD